MNFTAAETGIIKRGNDRFECLNCARARVANFVLKMPLKRNAFDQLDLDFVNLVNR